MGIVLIPGAITPHEAFTWFLSSQTPQEAMRILRADTDAPLHHMLVREVIRTFGDSTLSMRLPLFVACVLALPVIMMIAVARTQLAYVAAGACLIFTTVVILFRSLFAFDTELLALVMGIFAVASMLGYWQTGKAWFVVLFALATAAALWADNASIVLLVALHVAWAAHAIKHGPRSLVALAIADHIILAVYIPWMPSLYDQLTTFGVRSWAPTLTMFAATAIACWGTAVQSERVAKWTIIAWAIALFAAFNFDQSRALLDDHDKDGHPLRQLIDGSQGPADRTLIVCSPSELQLVIDYHLRDVRRGQARVGLPVGFRLNDPPRRSHRTPAADWSGFGRLLPQIQSGQYDRLLLVTASDASSVPWLELPEIAKSIGQVSPRVHQLRWLQLCAFDLSKPGTPK